MQDFSTLHKETIVGCDIHTFFEYQNPDGSWHTLPSSYTDNWKRLYGEDECSEDEREKILNDYWEDPLYIGRNYNLFAILANVRNGRGFAGAKTGEGFIPISEPRGFPMDACEETKTDYCARFYEEDVEDQTPAGIAAAKAEYEERCREWIAQGYSQLINDNPFMVSGPDWHSASYYTLQELLDYDGWEQTTALSGVLSQEEYATWKDSGETFPVGYAAGVYGPGVMEISEAAMRERIAQGRPAVTPATEEGNADTCYYCRAAIPVTYRECAKTFVEKTIPALKELADKQVAGDYTKVRFVFWFDN